MNALRSFTRRPCQPLFTRQLSRRFCQLKITKTIDNVHTHTEAVLEPVLLVAPSIFKYTFFPITLLSFVFGGALYSIYYNSINSAQSLQRLQNASLTRTLDAMEEKSRNLLQEFEADWQHSAQNLSLWMYMKRICRLFFSFSTVICSFPFIFCFNSISPNSSAKDWWFRQSVSSFEHGGVVFIKFGQWISCRPDLFGNDICRHMRKLCNSVQPHAMAYNKQVIEDAFGVPFEELFESFDETAHHTSGSIAQVHKAVLRQEIVAKHKLPFKTVAVKVRHPMAADMNDISLDLNIIFAASSVFKWIGQFVTRYGYFCTIPISLDEFEQIIARQCDLRFEAAQMIQFQVNFKRDAMEQQTENNRYNPNRSRSAISDETRQKHIVFPTMVPVFCVADVIMESWEDGHNVADVLHAHNDAASVMSLDWAVDLGLEAYSRMLFKHRLVHCDMHSGNLLVDAQKQSMAILDGGLCVTPSEADVSLFAELLMDSLCGLAHNVGNIVLSLDEEYADFINLKEIQNKHHLLQNLEQINDATFETTMYTYLTERLPSNALSEKAIALHRDLVQMYQENETYLQFKQKWNADRSNWERLTCDRFYELSSLINNMVIICQRNGIKLRSDFCSLCLALGVMEGVCKTVNPNQDLIERCWPFIDEVHGFDRIEHKFESLGGRTELLNKFGFL